MTEYERGRLQGWVEAYDFIANMKIVDDDGSESEPSAEMVMHVVTSGFPKMIDSLRMQYDES